MKFWLTSNMQERHAEKMSDGSDSVGFISENKLFLVEVVQIKTLK
jgi:hypothetical protein